MYHQFKNRVKLTATLKAETALYIGAGQESFSPMAVQGSLLKDQHGYPCIPGSSLKGVLRSFLESVQEEEKYCERGQRCAQKYETKEKRKKEKGNLSDAAFAKNIYADACAVCRLFGNGVMAGKLKFADARLANIAAWLGTELRTGNAIDRDTHTTVAGVLYDTEVIPAGTEFKLRITAENLSEEEARIFSQLMRHFANGGITVGGRSRAGLGTVEADQIAVEVFYMKPKQFAPEKEVAPSLEELAEFLAERKAAYV